MSLGRVAPALRLALRTGARPAAPFSPLPALKPRWFSAAPEVPQPQGPAPKIPAYNAKPMISGSYFSPEPQLFVAGGSRSWNGKLVDIQLSFDEWGDPRGYPVFYMHGQPGSRVEGVLFHEMALQKGIRLICIDRPGMGLSEDSIYRGLLEWPLQLRGIARSLNLSSFGVVSWSGGAPSALACAYALPDYVKFVHCWAPTAPYGPMPWELKKTLDVGDVVYSYLARIWRFFLFRAFSREAERTTRAANAEELFEGLKNLCFADQSIIQRRDVAAVLKDARLEVFRCGSKGAAVDAALVYQNWGFELKDLPDYIPLKLFHGKDDTLVPPGLAKWMADDIPHARLKMIPDQGHFFCFASEVSEMLMSEVAADAGVFKADAAEVRPAPKRPLPTKGLPRRFGGKKRH